MTFQLIYSHSLESLSLIETVPSILHFYKIFFEQPSNDYHSFLAFSLIYFPILSHFPKNPYILNKYNLRNIISIYMP